MKKEKKLNDESFIDAHFIPSVVGREILKKINLCLEPMQIRQFRFSDKRAAEIQMRSYLIVVE